MKNLYFKIIKKIFRENFYKIYYLNKLIYFSSKPFEKIISMNRNDCYEYFLNYFHFKSENYIVNHRKYFKINKLGYGEDAFHAMWNFVLSEYKPKNILEIGVYRGQTLSLFELISNKNNLKSEIWGLSPLTSDADEVSNYVEIDYFQDIKKNFKKFNLNEPKIFKGFSIDKKAVEFINSKKWDLIYIDGSHDYDVVLADVKNSIRNLSQNGILVMDDSSLYTDFNFKANGVSVFKGHPGPSRVFQSLLENKSVSYLFGVGHNNIFVKN